MARIIFARLFSHFFVSDNLQCYYIRCQRFPASHGGCYMLFALNYLSVFIYGLLIMTFFLDIKINKKSIFVLSVYVVVGIIINFSLYFLFGDRFLQKAYPLVIHLPLLIFFHVYYKKPLYNVLFVLCTTYILTTPRRWIGDFIALAFFSEPNVAAIVQIAVTIPLLYIIYKYLRTYIIKIIAYSDYKIRFLLIIPLIYYVIAYLTTVYTVLLYSSRIVVVGILSIGLVSTFSYFLIVYFNELVKGFDMKNEQNILAVQVSALQARSETMRQAEENTKIYRHDLRHHLQMIHSYLLANNVDEAKNYIIEIEKNMYQNVTITHCENDAVNLILSSYIGMANQKDIFVESEVSIPKSCKIQDIDLCIIFANAIENAINACTNIEDIAKRHIDLNCKTKNGKLFIQISNSYTDEVTFRNDMPITERENHGYGTKSIAAIAQKYNGIYSFRTESGIFKMNVILYMK